uniref:Uncharacterized protein n=1 Tax=Fibrocapsa japonica TaxID=94617 RepID=A0A7S2UW48_9STRA|mmetsp:Transcript_12862/g.18983  ORF Transcript_12862/g.18983 Transcript_12862/m.18983 type:complete len:188 (+) Transcript_12862:119-682(+)|eukprot:CAMPEP_0113938054 /NCGR_PEP_ID=MMETSP1339-20121228/4483_1 /TAXON_ID=94617 /ORGANISM="Fibrocapsa japonica" /LENGTH=187 /DNA_ID=CAMNT_0000940989 /DNA_START=46 /DNA_END=609 /DNA_ORIENTATION=- /assembly_acc=CAM_ASM_000762
MISSQEESKANQQFSASGMDKKLEQLYEQKASKLAQQKNLSDEFNEILTREGGLNEVSRQACKNLEAAVAVAQRPGYFEYYQAPAEVQRIIAADDLKLLTNKINQIQRELDQIDSEIEQLSKQHYSQRNPPQVNNLGQWFAVYGTPKPPPNGTLSVFEPSDKVYGGTQHHRAFKSQSRSLKKGTVLK